MKDETLHYLLEEHNLAKAIRSIKSKVEKKILVNQCQPLSGIESDYQLMCNFMAQGYRDPKADAVYGKLLQRTLRLYANLQMETLKAKEPTFIDATSKAYQNEDLSSYLQETLESFVQDLAIASLDTATSPAALADLYSRHQTFIDRAFASLLVSPQWTGPMADDITQVLLSPTIDINDALVLVSALTLSVISVFDINKWIALTQIYTQATDERLRQRALVGWMLSLPQDENISRAEIREHITRFCSNPNTRQELLELQIQLFFCCNTEADNTEIQQNILPKLMKGNNLKITRTGIVEIEEDPMKDILESETTNREMEQMEETFNRMKAMQDAGSDIYFGGFSQMKRYSFFYKLSNWFFPFTTQHPQITETVRKIGIDGLMDNLSKTGPFCDSDKYSFVLGLSTIIGHIPENVKEMLGSSMTLTVAPENEKEREKPAYIRRLYLQDLYRFFNLYHRKNDFHNPFQWDDTCFFMKRNLFLGNAVERDQLCLFLYKRHRHQDIIALYENVSLPQTTEATVILAQEYLLAAQYDAAQSLFQSVLDKNTDNERALRGLGRVHFAQHRYDKAGQVYRKLSLSYPENTRYEQNLAISLICDNQLEEGMQRLYRLHYEHEDDAHTTRALAWGSLLSKKAKEAASLYITLIEKGKAITADYLNAAYALWFQSKMSEAIDMFHKYAALCEEKDHTLSQDFSSDQQLFVLYGITQTEQMLMADIVG